MERENLQRWQGLEHEFRLGISSESPELCRYARFYHVDEVIDALKNYTFFDGSKAICTKMERKKDGFLRNGSRIYICTGGHIEIATPECRDAFDLLRYDKATELYMQIGVEKANEKYLDPKKKAKRKDDLAYIQCWKANVEIDKQYNRGTHESYIVKRENFLGKEHLLVPFLVIRKIFFGAGGYVADKERIKYVISPKAMVSRRVFAESPSQWPILSLRDEPLSTKDNYRVHVTSGEGVRSEVTRLLCNAITSYVIDAIESGKIMHLEPIWNPLQTSRDLSAEIGGEWRIKLVNGKTESALDYLMSNYLGAIEELFEEREVSYWDKYALDTFKRVCAKFDQGLIDDRYVYRRIEWVMKLWVLKNELNDFEYKQIPREKFDYRSMYMKNEQIELEKEIAASFDFTNLCDYDLYECIADKIGVERVLTEEEIGEALLFPPRNSRAELRLRLASEFDDENTILSWNKIAITSDIGQNVNNEEYTRIFERYPELARMSSGIVVFYRERNRRERSRRVLVRLLAEEEDIMGWEEEISRERGNLRISRNPYVDFFLYTYNRTYRFDELDGWNEETIKKKIDEIRRAENNGE